MIESIAHAANEQAAVSEAVAVAMSQISEITSQTNTGTQEAAASVSYLSELAEQLRASVSTFRLPDHGNEVMDLFPGMTSITALPEESAALVGVRASMDNDWGQNFSMNFPPLSDPRHSSSVAALTAHAGQFSFGNQQSFTSQPNFGDQQQFSSPPGFGGQQQFGGQSNFGDLSDFESQQNFNGQQQFATGAEFGGQSQSFYAQPNQVPFSQQPNSGSLQQSQQPGQTGQGPTARQRRLGGPQQNQSSYDPWSFPNNGQ